MEGACSHGKCLLRFISWLFLFSAVGPSPLGRIIGLLPLLRAIQNGSRLLPGSHQGRNSILSDIVMLIMPTLTAWTIPAKALINCNLSRFPEYVLESGLTSVQKRELLTFKLEMATETTAGFPPPTEEDLSSACSQANAAGLSARRSPPDSCQVTEPLCLLLNYNWLINLHLQVNASKDCPVTTGFLSVCQIPLIRASLDWQPRKGRALFKTSCLSNQDE